MTISSDLLRRRDIGNDISEWKHRVANERHEEATGEQSSWSKFYLGLAWRPVIGRFWKWKSSGLIKNFFGGTKDFEMPTLSNQSGRLF